MTFIRTPSGLSNLYLFVGADAVVFLEGGKGYSLFEIEEGKFDDISSDIRFWENNFAAHLPTKKYQFRSIGSKSALLKIATKIKNKHIRNVIVAMDNDFDSINGKLISCTNVIYTSGYSWENDVWCDLTILNTFKKLVGLSAFAEKDVKDQIKKMLSEFSCKIRKAVRLDIVLNQNNCSLFNRKTPARYISIASDGCPSVNIQQIRTSIAEARLNNNSPILRKLPFKYDPIANCFGHLVSEFCYRVVSFLIKTFRRLPRIAKAYVASAAVSEFFLALNAGSFPTLKAHYQAEFSRITY